jgi:hypothetical protein
MGLQAAVHLGHMPWALTKEEEEEYEMLFRCCSGGKTRKDNARRDLRVLKHVLHSESIGSKYDVLMYT